MKDLKEEILCAGHGGQGIMLMGKLLAYAGMQAGYNVTWIPSYGAEVRGGTAHSMVRIQKDGPIANPMVTNPTSCIVMNKPSLAKFIHLIKPGGLLIVDTTEINDVPVRIDINIKKAPLTKIAIEVGDKRAANIVAIGYFNKIKNMFAENELTNCIPFIFTRNLDLVKINEKALARGYAIDIK